MGVRPMSPSANFTTYNLPPSDDGHRSSYTIPRPRGAGGSGSGRAMGAFRFLLCSRPCFQQSVDIDQEGTSFDSHQHHHLDEDHHVQSGNGDEDWKARMEMQAILRHLEVRWQLFNEALSRFRDLEAMLAICADKVRWRHYSVEGASDAHLAEDLKSLIARKVSMEVTIDRITQLSYSGELGSTFDRDGNWGQLQPRDRVKAESALELFLESREEIGSDWLRSSRLNVLEEDSYILCNQRGEVVEEGKQVVIWEQYNSTWYIRGCISYPSSTSS